MDQFNPQAVLFESHNEWIVLVDAYKLMVQRRKFSLTREDFLKILLDNGHDNDSALRWISRFTRRDGVAQDDLDEEYRLKKVKLHSTIFGSTAKVGYSSKEISVPLIYNEDGSLDLSSVQIETCLPINKDTEQFRKLNQGLKNIKRQITTLRKIM